MASPYDPPFGRTQKYDRHIKTGRIELTASPDGMKDFVTRMWVGQHADDTIQQLQHERADLVGRMQKAAQMGDWALQDRLRSMLAAADALIEHKRIPNHDRPVLDMDEILIKPRQKPKTPPKRKLSPYLEKHRREEAARLKDLERRDLEWEASKRARANLLDGIAQKVAVDPAAQEATAIGEEIKTAGAALHNLIEQAESPQSQRYITDEEISRSIQGLITKMRDLALLKVSLEKKYNVTLSVTDDEDLWDRVRKTSAGSTFEGGGNDAITEAMRFVTARRIDETSRKYGLRGRQPLRAKGQPGKRFSEEEMTRDLQILLGYERQNQLLGSGADENNPNGAMVSAIMQKVIQIADEQDLADIKAAGGKISLEDCHRYAIKYLGRERQDQLLGSEGGSSQTRQEIERIILQKAAEFDRKFRLEQAPRIRAQLEKMLFDGQAMSQAEIELIIQNYVNANARQ